MYSNARAHSVYSFDFICARVIKNTVTILSGANREEKEQRTIHRHMRARSMGFCEILWALMLFKINEIDYTIIFNTTRIAPTSIDFVQHQRKMKERGGREIVCVFISSTRHSTPLVILY